MNSDEMVRLCREHTMYTWGAGDAMDVVPVERAEGVYFWTPDGKRFIDFNSQLMSVNIGHSHPKVVEKMKALMDGLIFVHPGTATESRALLGPIGGVLVADYFLVRKTVLDVEGLYRNEGPYTYQGGFNPAAMI
ncbi:aminotransferase class III-fold pyridoxal phosphate-dependent enzyme, partial [Myxococcota bacterium]|nr:aminotransferase class III-fold pyridoxal phosphate-dependent enzyme [Myxococcota bacterium]